MKKNAFTFVEMLIVLLIVSLLYASAALYISGLQHEARVSKAKGDLKTIQMAIVTYMQKHNACPKKEDYQIILTKEVPNIIIGNLFDPFASSVNAPYLYNISDNQCNYVCFSVGPLKNGSAKIGDEGKIFINGFPILVSNGFF